MRIQIGTERSMTTKKSAVKRIACVICGASVLAAGGCGSKDPAVFSYVRDSQTVDEATRTYINYNEGGTESSAETETAVLGAEELAKVQLPFAAEYFVSFLSEEEQQVCRQIYSGFRNFETKINITEDVISSEDICSFIVLCTSCAPELDYIGQEYTVSMNEDGYVVALEVDYELNREQAAKRQNDLEARVDEIMSGVSAGMSDYDKVKYFHDTIIKNCDYDDSRESCYTAYGCLVEGKAVCEGYAKAMLVLCERAEIGCLPVVGQGYEGDSAQPHIWNKVLIDGEWYGFDLTWDDPVSDMGADYIRYDYFGLDDAEMDSDHEADENKYLYYPEAVSDEADYFVKNNCYVQDVYSSLDIMENAVRNAMGADEDYVRIKCSDEETYLQTYQRIFESADGGITPIFEFLKEASDVYPQGGYSSMSYSIIKNQVMHTITVKMDRSSL